MTPTSPAHAAAPTAAEETLAPSTPWHALAAAEVTRQLQTDPERGISPTEAERRRQQYGPNQLARESQRSPLAILLGQFRETMVLILVGAGIISYFIGDPKDTIVILAIVILNAILGFVQEYRAEKAVEALSRLTVPSVVAIRDGEACDIPATELVPGDLVRVEAGNAVPADARVVRGMSLQVQEAALTGESAPVDKSADPALDPGTPLADRLNMLFMGTLISHGRGRAVVTATGMRTELGQIARMIQTVEKQPTPLQRRMDQLGKRLAVVAGVLVTIVFLLGMARGGHWQEMLLTAISLAVAAVPEGLPAIVTIALALGARRMVNRRALIRRLPAVETLGSVTTICSDKTGTLTENQMAAARLATIDTQLDLGAAARGESTPSPLGQDLELLLLAGSLANDAEMRAGADAAAPTGDPTETAIVSAALRFGLHKQELDRQWPRVAELPFSSERKRMSTIHEVPPDTPWAQTLGTSHVLFGKGAVDSLLESCTRVWSGGRPVALTADRSARISRANDDWAQAGYRVLGMVYRPIDALPVSLAPHETERDLTFVGLIALIDPPRPEAKDAVARARAAGIRPIMITGDHSLTAQAIATQLDICRPGDRVVTGRELESMSADELRAIVEDVAVYARVSPEHKLKIVEALQARGHNTAMTGDGVNDAPPLKRSDIGVAMGITGTDVAKEASDMILLDDNFATIVAAIEEGRTIYDNIRKFVKYLLSSNAGEIWTMMLAPIAGLPVPLLPLQILWINLVTDGLPALALGVEPAERDVMGRPPYRPNESVFARGMWQTILWVGLLMGLLSFGVQKFSLSRCAEQCQTMVFNTLVLCQLANVLAIRSDRQSLFRQGLFSNPWMVAAVLSTVGAQLLVLYLPFMQRTFNTQPLSLPQFLVTAALASLIFVAVELEKWFKRRRARADAEA